MSHRIPTQSDISGADLSRGFNAFVPKLFRPILPLEVPQPHHSPRGQWLAVGWREALTGKNFYKFFVVISLLSEMPNGCALGIMWL